MDPLEIARRFVDAQFPQAELAIVAGSTARGTRTATSDIDLLLIGPASMFQSGAESASETHEFDGEVLEVFAYTEESFATWAERGIAQFRPVILEMLLSGRSILDHGLREALERRWRPIHAAGATPSPEQIAMRRYIVTDLVDDLSDATDALEAHTVMASLFVQLSELMLLTNRRWIGTGKYLVRRLREWDPDRARAITDPYLASDRRAFVRAANAELGVVGGRLQAGHVR